MSRKSNSRSFHLGAVAAVVVMIAGGLLAAAPARADHDRGPDVGFHFFFGFPPPPPPPVIIEGPPPVYYYEPAPRVVIQSRPGYREWHYYHERDYPRSDWRYRNHRARPHYRD